MLNMSVAGLQRPTGTRQLPVKRELTISELAPEGPRYRPFAFRHFIDARGAGNYADAGVPDTQISAFPFPLPPACSSGELL